MSSPFPFVGLALAMLATASACAGAAQPTGSALPPMAPVAASQSYTPGPSAASSHLPAAVTLSDAEVKKTRGASKPLFQVRLISEVKGRTLRPAGEAATQ